MAYCYIVLGTSTAVGKSHATAALAHHLITNNISVATAKVIQTGDDNDLNSHLSRNRQIVKQHIFAEFTLPASAHVAARQVDYQFDVELLQNTVSSWIESNDYHHLIIELSGGLFMPIVSKINQDGKLETYNQKDLVEYLLNRFSDIKLLLTTPIRLGCLNSAHNSLQAISHLSGFKGKQQLELLINLYNGSRSLSYLERDNIEQLMILSQDYCKSVGIVPDSNLDTETISQQIDSIAEFEKQSPLGAYLSPLYSKLKIYI